MLVDFYIYLSTTRICLMLSNVVHIIKMNVKLNLSLTFWFCEFGPGGVKLQPSENCEFDQLCLGIVVKQLYHHIFSDFTPLFKCLLWLWIAFKLLIITLKALTPSLRYHISPFLFSIKKCQPSLWQLVELLLEIPSSSSIFTFVVGTPMIWNSLSNFIQQSHHSPYWRPGCVLTSSISCSL